MSRADCTGLRGFQTRGHCEDDFGDNHPITETSVAVSERIVVRDRINTAHNFIHNILRFTPVVPKQQKSCHDAPNRCDYGEVTGKLGRSAGMVSGINARYRQERHVGVQQHSALSR